MTQSAALSTLPHATIESVATLVEVASAARDLAAASKAGSTRRAYESDWKHFAAWCEAVGLASLPAAPETVGLYIAAHAETLKPSTMARRLASISTVHRTVGAENPASMRHGAVADVLRGMRRVRGTAQPGKTALVAKDVKFLLAGLPDTLQGERDAAILLLGFSGAFRRSELVALNVEDLMWEEAGLVVEVRKSKTDQEGQGRRVGIPYSGNLMLCPVRRLKRWLEKAGISEGAIFRPINRHGHVLKERLSGQGVWLLVKRVCEEAGMDASEFGAHSLRSGFVTTALGAGKSETKIIEQTGHKSTVMLRRYNKSKDFFQNNPAEGLL